MTIKLDSLSRIVIPKVIRKALGIESGDEIKLTLKDKMLIITKK
jgi:AbrB family looped-hinge helix DNA binding protein